MGLVDLDRCEKIEMRFFFSGLAAGAVGLGVVVLVLEALSRVLRWERLRRDNTFVVRAANDCNVCLERTDPVVIHPTNPICHGRLLRRRLPRRRFDRRGRMGRRLPFAVVVFVRGGKCLPIIVYNLNNNKK